MQIKGRYLLAVGVAIIVGSVVVFGYTMESHTNVLAGEMRIQTNTNDVTMTINPAKLRTWNVDKGELVSYELNITNIDQKKHTYRLDTSDIHNTRVVVSDMATGDIIDQPTNIIIDGGESITVQISAAPVRSTEVRISIGNLVGREFDTRFVSRWLIEVK